MKKDSLLREKSITATILLIAVTVVLFIAAYCKIADIMEDRCLSRMEDGVDIAAREISTKLSWDSQLLNAAAELMAETPELSPDVMRDTVRTIDPLLATSSIHILLPDDTIILANGETVSGRGTLSFAREASLGEHISDRVVSLLDNNELVLRHFVPVVQDGSTVALVYSVTYLDDLPGMLNVNHMYNAQSNLYIVDTKTGDYIMDTAHTVLGNIRDFPDRKTRDSIPWPLAMQQILSGQSGHVVFWSEVKSEWMYMYYMPAGINQWSIAIAVPELEAFSGLYAIQRVCWIVALLIAVAILFYYLWVRKDARRLLKKSVEKAVLEEKLQKAEAAERAKTAFLSNMSHDIRTPMNAIIGFTTLAQSNLSSQEKVRDYLDKILASSNHLLSLINDILDMSRIESGKLNIEAKECCISDIFRDMRNILQTQMQAKQLNFFLDTIDVVDEDIYCDKLHLNQVLLNLLSNAIKFTPAGGSVSLTIRQRHSAPSGYGAYEIRVKDTGIGMSPEFAVHVFEPFERERTTTVSGIQGTGLGMAIAKSIVDAMGGTIELHTAPGKGTEFVLNFEFRLMETHRQIEIAPELKGLRVLVVDDSFSTCDSVTKMLGKIGMRSEWSMHGREAVLRARQATEMDDAFRAYVIDWSLPDLNGVEVARQISAIAEPHTPILLLTAYDWSSIEQEARSAGVTAFCSKPVFLSDLRDTLLAAFAPSDPVMEASSLLPEAADDLKGRRLLLVEDTELNREIAEAILTESGFLVDTAEDGTVAVEKVKGAAPGYYDLILMDVQMPQMNGYEATRAIRELDDPALANIPIVAMTANAFEEDRKAALACGMNAHISKPIDLEKLMETLQKLLRR